MNLNPLQNISNQSRYSLMPNANMDFNRLSVLPDPRASMAPTKSPDPRHAKDRQVFNESVNTLYQFLSINGYPHPVSLDLLKRPSSKDFSLIFEWMIKEIDPNFTFASVQTVGQEIAIIFKLLGYPHSITKSAFMTVGAPHTWPSLLAALIWLKDLVIHENEVKSTLPQDTMFSRNLEDTENLVNLFQSYSFFLETGEKINEGLKIDLSEKYELQCNSEQEQIRMLEDYLRNLKEQLVSLEQNSNSKIEKDLDVLSKEVDKLNTQIEHHTKHKMMNLARSEKMQLAIDELKKESRGLSNERAEIEAVLSQQTYQNVAADLNELTVRIPIENETYQKMRFIAEEELKLTNSALEKQLAECEAVYYRQISLSDQIQKLVPNYNPPEDFFQKPSLQVKFQAEIETTLYNTLVDIQRRIQMLIDAGDAVGKKKLELAATIVEENSEKQKLEDEAEELLRRINEFKKKKEESIHHLSSERSAMEKRFKNNALQVSLEELDKAIQNKVYELKSRSDQMLKDTKEGTQRIHQKMEDIIKTKQSVQSTLMSFNQQTKLYLELL